MTTFENVITVQKPAAEVFAYLAAFENVPRWNYAIVETRRTSPGPVGVGSVYEQTRSIPAHAVESFEVTRFEPDRELEIRGQLGPFPAVVSYVLEPAPGGTLLRNTVQLELHGPLKLAGPVVSAQVKKAVAANLEVLRQILAA